MSTETQTTTESMLRCMAWERAKGELYSMLSTFRSLERGTPNTIGNFNGLNDAIDEFVEKVESHALHE